MVHHQRPISLVPVSKMNNINSIARYSHSNKTCDLLFAYPNIFVRYMVIVCLKVIHLIYYRRIMVGKLSCYLCIIPNSPSSSWSSWNSLRETRKETIAATIPDGLSGCSACLFSIKFINTYITHILDNVISWVEANTTLMIRTAKRILRNIVSAYHYSFVCTY